MQPPAVKQGFLADCNSAVTADMLEAVMQRNASIADRYHLEKDCFARGKFAQVRRIQHKVNGQFYAAKTIKKRRPRHGNVTDEIMHEIRVLLTASDCEHIVNLYEVYETATEFILVLELAEGGELQRILDEDDCIEESVSRRLMREIVQAVRFLHRNQIAHLDIKPQNILLTGSLPDGKVKLCDFGISRLIDKSSEIREIMGTVDYMPPEILQYEPISLASDMWSIGIVAYVLLSGHSPFGGDDKVHTYSNITSGELEFPDHLFEDVSEQAKDFIQRLLVRDPNERLNCDECLAHEWLQDVQCTSAENVTAAVSVDGPPSLMSANDTCDQSLPVDTVQPYSGSKPCIIISSHNNQDSITCDSQQNNVQTETSDDGDIEMDASSQQSSNVTQTQPLVKQVESIEVNVSVKLTADGKIEEVSYDSDKENDAEFDLISSTVQTNGGLKKSSSSSSNLQSHQLSYGPSWKNHKRLSSDIFPSSEHQKLIAVVASNSLMSSGNGLSSSTSSLMLKQKQSIEGHSVMSALDLNSTGIGGGSGSVASSNAADSNNNSLIREAMMKAAVAANAGTGNGTIPIPIVDLNKSSTSSIGVDNSNGTGEQSPPSTPNKKIYLSIDDSFCGTESFNRSYFSSNTTSNNSSISKMTTMLSTAESNSPRIRSISVERLSSMTKCVTSDTNTAPLTDSEELFVASPLKMFNHMLDNDPVLHHLVDNHEGFHFHHHHHHHHHHSSMTAMMTSRTSMSTASSISGSSSASSSLSSLPILRASELISHTCTTAARVASSGKLSTAN